MIILGRIQLGKNGLTENFMNTLKNHFKKHNVIKISVLKSCCRDRGELKKISEEILESLGKKYRIRIIGYTIIIKKLRKPAR